MKGFKKVFYIFIATLMLFTLSVTAFAGNETNDGNIKIQVATDKGSYGATGVAEITATIINVSGEDINNVTAQAVFDDLAPAGKRKSETSKSVDVLKSGESFSFTYKATLNKDEHKLNFFQKIILWFVRLFNGGYNANNDNIDVVAECVTEIEFGKFTVENVVQVGYEENIIVSEKYITIDQTDFLTVENQQQISGTINISDDIEKLYFSVTSDYGIEKYDIENIYNNKWESSVFNLKPGDNKIKVYLKTKNNEYISDIINIEYDRGESYEASEDSISYDEEYDGYYINNIVLVTFTENTTEQRKQEIVNSINGKIVGRLNTVNELHIEISPRNLNQLEVLCDELEKNEDVEFATWDEVYDIRSSDLPIDDWGYGDNYDLIDWNEENPMNNEWWLEAIKAPSAWNYNSYFNKIKVGIIDSGFDINHEDLNLLFPTEKDRKNNEPNNHGTHVAGIIGAKRNNGKGIAGVIDDKKLDLYAFSRDYLTLKTTRGSQIYDGLVALVESGCKIINVSQGLDDLKYCDETLSKRKVNKWGETASEKIAILLKKGYDFVVIDAAGNGARNRNDKDEYLGVDAIYDGLFSSITESNCYNKNIPANEIMDRVIVVANAVKLDSYQLATGSNGGSQVDIAAPGTNIYSTIAGIAENYDDGTVKYTSGQKYGLMSGTSMAAPIVAGVAGLVWSVNKDFTGAEVKEIVIETAKKGNIWVKDNPDSPTTGDFPLVNAKLAVEEAIYRTYETGYAQGLILEEITEKPIEGAVVSFVSNNEKESITTVTTDENGNYDYQLPIGSYTVSVSHEKYYSTETKTIEVLQDKHCIVNPLYMEKASQIFGTVTDITTQERISGVKVEVVDNESGNFEPFATTTTDQYGDYSLLLPYGSYSLSFNHDDYEYYGVALNVEDESYIKDIALSPESGIGDDDRTVTASGNCGADGDNVTWTLYEDGELVISGNGAMEDYTSDTNQPPWHEYKNNIKSVVFLDGMLKIGDKAFYSCENLTSLTISNSVKHIGWHAFNGCSSLENIEIPDSVERIEYAFYNTAYFNNSDNWENGVLYSALYIGNHLIAVGGKTQNSDTYTIRDNTVTIADFAFEGCNFKTVNIPNSVKIIGSNAFLYCEKLKSITIPESVENINSNAFDECRGLVITINNPSCIIHDSALLGISATIYGYKNSTADSYAKKYSLKFYILNLQPGDPGTKENPYKISTVEDFRNISNAINIWYEVVNDIDFSNVEWITSFSFNGNLNGNGYTLKNLTCNKSDTSGDYRYFGIFTTNSGSISNLVLENITIKVEKLGAKSPVTFDCIGSIVGRNKETGIIENCIIKSGNITSSLSTTKTDNCNGVICGGIAGENEGKISHCINSANIDINATYSVSAGGIVGQGNVSDSLNTGNVIVFVRTGIYRNGLARSTTIRSSGITGNGTVSNCANAAETIEATGRSNPALYDEELHVDSYFIGGYAKEGNNYAWEQGVCCYKGKTSSPTSDYSYRTSESGVTMSSIETIKNIWSNYQF